MSATFKVRSTLSRSGMALKLLQNPYRIPNRRSSVISTARLESVISFQFTVFSKLNTGHCPLNTNPTHLTMLTPTAYQPGSLPGTYTRCEASGTVSNLGEGFPLRCFQRLSTASVATQRCSLRTTGALEACPLRSSRTSKRTPQKPNACTG